MTCTLVISGSKTSVKSFLDISSLLPDQVYEEHFVLLPSNRGLHEFGAQIEDVIHYLNKNGQEIRELSTRFGLECERLDFAIAQSDVYVQSVVLPAELVFLAGRLGLDFQLSRYPVSAEGDQHLPARG